MDFVGRSWTEPVVDGKRSFGAMKASLAVVAAVNDEKVLQTNLAASPLINETGIPLIIERGHLCAGAAYNAGMLCTDAEVIIFPHQDVYLPMGWEARVFKAIDDLNEKKCKWGVLGVYGVKSSGQHTGRVWSSGLGHEIGGSLKEPQAVVSIDELVIILRRECNLWFDEELPGFHLYGTDIVQTAFQHGFEAYVFDAPVVHNSNPVVRLDESYWNAYSYVQKKWHATLPIPTCVVPITRFNWQRRRYRMSMIKRRLMGWKPKTGRQDDPKILARKFGYESPYAAAPIEQETL